MSDAAQHARDAAARALVPHPAICVFFFFFATTRTDSRQCGSDSGRFTLIRADSGRIGHIGETAETHRASTEQENENKQKMDKNL